MSKKIEAEIFRYPSKPYKLISYFRFQRSLSLFKIFINERLESKSVIIVGCWAGLEGSLLMKAKNYVIGLDINYEALRITKDKLSDVVLGDAESLPFKSGAFDMGFVHMVLHHLPSPYIGLEELM